MNEFNIVYSINSPQQKNVQILITVENEPKENLLYKYIVGCEGKWKTIKDYDDENSVLWTPEEDGKYIIMVQAKEQSSTKSFDYVSKRDYIIGTVEEKIINNLKIDKEILKLGEKLTINVEVTKSPVMYRFWIREKDNWELIKDYSTEDQLIWSVRNAGTQEILVECKEIDSKNKYDDFKSIKFEVLPIDNIEIIDFKCLVPEIIVDKELMFEVDAKHEKERMILYKFIKVDAYGVAACIQNYSTKRMVSFTEKTSGDYKILCMAKDMYSQKEYDDRAIINYTVKPYKDIYIQKFTSDLSSPQLCDTSITFTATTYGGRELQYRFIIDGNYGEDSGYTRSNSYIWETKSPGDYKIELWVKDYSYQGNYEAKAELQFRVDENTKEPVNINEVILDKEKDMLVNSEINVKVIASGGMELRYKFIIRKNGKELEKIDYGTCNYARFIPESAGTYEMEVMVRDRYSKREFDSHSIVYLEAYDYIPANIDYVLLPTQETYVVGDNITLNTITQNTKNTLIKYSLYINDHKVEETEYVKNKKYVFVPKCSGSYTVEIYAKNIDSKKSFDCKKNVQIKIHDAIPITNTKVQCDKLQIYANEAVTFTASSEGGKEILYEFYLLENGEWNLVQGYSRKNYYGFVPFTKGDYKILALCKSRFKKCSYEDYGMFDFSVE